MSEPRSCAATMERMHQALDDLAAALEAMVMLAPAEVALATMAAKRAETAQDAGSGLIRLPLPEPGFALLYGHENASGRFFLMLEQPDGERRPLRW